MSEINLLKSIKKVKRNIKYRLSNKNKDVINISRKFGKDYFDGDRAFGYGGYFYDGRWKKVAKDIIKFYNLKKGDRVLDVGCAKGFLVKDLVDKGIDAYGTDVSKYAVKNSHKDVKDRISLGNVKKLNFKKKSFKLVLAINVIHNLTRADCGKALKEISRVTSKYSFIQVDSYKTKQQKKIFKDWVLTAKFHLYPAQWKAFFIKNNYQGDYFWTFL
jgi:ubiquinone/menaquinone biosynthesis C-methylase UbiE